MFHRPMAGTLRERLSERPRQIQIVVGPRQVGKTTLVSRIIEGRDAASALYITADQAASAIEVAGSRFPVSEISPPRSPRPDTRWLILQWQRAAAEARAWSARTDSNARRLPYVLAVDEIQKIPNWSETVKGLWDENLRNKRPIHLVLLGSSPLLVQKGLSESLAGRFELIRMPHWSYEEMSEGFSWTLDQYIYFGGYPGSARHISEEGRWRAYVLDALIRPNIEKDVLEMTRVDQPALLKQLFEVGSMYSGQVVALDKMLGVLNSKGNTVTLSRYLDLLERAGLLRGLLKYSAHEVRRRRSPPKFQVFNTSFVTALGTHSFDEARADRSYWGRLVESAVGVHLCNALDANMQLHYWREGHLEVDFVVSKGRRLLAIEVKSGRKMALAPGLDEFRRRHSGCRTLVVGGVDCPLGEFLRQPIDRWMQ
jgi:predicted AAA+ superfamily ATPase